MVLPAPLGPMMPTISPGATASDTPSTAWMPPKRTDTSTTSSAGVTEPASAAAARATASLAAAAAIPAGVDPPSRPPSGRPRSGRASARRARPAAGPHADALEEHRAQQVGSLEQLGGRAVEPDLALLHEVGGLGDGQGQVHRLLDQDHRGALVADGLRRSGSSCSTTTGASPSDSSSISSSRGRARKAMPSASICCWPPDRLAAGSSMRCGQHRELGRAPRRCARPSSAGRRRSSQPATRRFSRTVSDGNTPWPPGTWRDAERRDLVGRGVGDVAPVEDHRALVGLDHPADGLQQRRLAGAVGAEQRDDLALVDLEVDVEEHLHVAVEHLQAAGTAAASPGPGGARRAPRSGPPPSSRPA